MVLATYVWTRTLNNLVLLNLWYYRFNFHQHILIWKQMKGERPNKQQIEDTSTLFIKSWVSQYFVIDKTTVLCSRSFTEKKDHSIWAFVWAKLCFFLDIFKSFPRNMRSMIYLHLRKDSQQVCPKVFEWNLFFLLQIYNSRMWGEWLWQSFVVSMVMRELRERKNLWKWRQFWCTKEILTQSVVQ